MPVTVTLVPWEPRVSSGYDSIQLDIQENKAVVRKFPNAEKNEPNGWFAIYEQDMFGVFCLPIPGDPQITLLIANRIWHLTEDVQLSWSQSSTRRSLTVRNANEVITFYYQKIWWHLLRRPLTAISEVVFADDWWGIVCDLPSWVEERWKAGKLADEIITFQQRHDSDQ